MGPDQYPRLLNCTLVKQVMTRLVSDFMQCYLPFCVCLHQEDALKKLDRSSKHRYFRWHFGPFKASGLASVPSSCIFFFFRCKLAWNQLTSNGQIPFWRGAPCRAGIRALPVRLMTLDWGPRWPLRPPATALTPWPLVSHTPLSGSDGLDAFVVKKKKL